ncbi:unnamed protein product [Urochloa humidicola]
MGEVVNLRVPIVTSPKSATVESLSMKLDVMLQRLEERIARMDGAPAPIVPAVAAPGGSHGERVLAPVVAGPPASSPTAAAAAAAKADVVITNALEPAAAPATPPRVTTTPSSPPPPLTATAIGATTGNVKRIVAAFEFARVRREMERRRQRMELSTSIVSATPSTTSSASLSSSASSTTPPAPTSAAPTSIDTTMPIPTTIRESVQIAPARCSTAVLTSSESTLAPVSAVLAPSSASSRVSTASAMVPNSSQPTMAAPTVLVIEEEVPIEVPTRCSTVRFSRNSATLKTMDTSTTIFVSPPTWVHVSSDSMLDNSKHSFEYSQRRYITNSTPGFSRGVVRFEKDADVHGNQTSQNPGMFDLLPAILVDKGKGLSILHSNQLSIPPKPPWSIACPEYDNFKSGGATLVSWMVWIHFLVHNDTVQNRHISWPPFHFLTDVHSEKGLSTSGHSTASYVFDRGKTWSEFLLAIRLHGTPLQAKALFFMEANSVTLQVGMKMNDANERINLQVGTRHCNKLIDDSIQLTHTKMVCGSVNQFMVNFLFGNIRWPSFWEHTTATYCQIPVFLLLVNPIADTQLFWYCPVSIQFKPPWPPFCCSKSGVHCHIFIQHKQQQVVATVRYWCGHSIDTVHCQFIIQGNLSTIVCWKSSTTAVIIKVIASRWISQTMQQSVTRLFFPGYFINVTTTLLLILHYSVAFDDELVTARPSRYPVLKLSQYLSHEAAFNGPDIHISENIIHMVWQVLHTVSITSEQYSQILVGWWCCHVGPREHFSTSSVNSSLVELHFSSSVTGNIVDAGVLKWLIGWESHTNGRDGIAEFFKCKCELAADENSGQKNGLQHLQVLVQMQWTIRTDAFLLAQLIDHYKILYMVVDSKKNILISAYYPGDSISMIGYIEGPAASSKAMTEWVLLSMICTTRNMIQVPDKMITLLALGFNNPSVQKKQCWVREKHNGFKLLSIIPGIFTTHDVLLNVRRDDILEPKLPMEHITQLPASSLVGGMTSSVMSFDWPMQLPTIHLRACHTSKSSRFPQVSGSLIFILHFYCLVIGDP